MRNMLVAALAFGMAMAFSLTASAGNIDQGSSFLDIKLGSVPQVRLTAQSDAVVLTGATTHTIAEAASVFQTDSFTVASAAFTGLPSLTALKISLHAGTGNFASSASYVNPVGPGTVSGFGGIETNTGLAVLQAGGFDFQIPLDVLGAGGTTNLAAVLANVLVVTGAPFNTGRVDITGLSSNIVQTQGTALRVGVAFTLNLTTVQLLTAVTITDGGLPRTNNTVVLAGTNNLASSVGGGLIKMVSPFRLST